MKYFEQPDDSQDTSIFIERSKQGNTLVAVAAVAHRDDEPTILNALHEIATDTSFAPFEGERIRPRRDEEILEEIIGQHHDHLLAARYELPPEKSRNEDEIYAILGALLVEQALETIDDPLIVLPSRQHAEGFVRAVDGLLTAPPPVDHCVKSRAYYPTALLAKLTAKQIAYLAQQGRLPNHPYEGVVVRSCSDPKPEQWGDAAQAHATSDRAYDPTVVRVVSKQEKRDRPYCWYAGAMAHPTADDLITINMQELFDWAVENGYERLAGLCRGFM